MGFLNIFKKRNEEIAEESSLKAHDHSAVRDNDPYAYEVSHNRLAWLFRISVALNIILGIGLAASYEAISSLVDAFEPKVALLRHDPKDNKLYRIEPINEKVEGFEVVLEEKAKRYVRLMLEVDRVTQDVRFREAFRMTDRGFYERFKEERIDTRKISRMLAEGITRSITVETVSLIDRKDKTYKYAVDFIQTDEAPNQAQPKIKQARAYLTMTTRQQEVREIDKYENPLGITVTDMVLKEKANS